MTLVALYIWTVVGFGGTQHIGMLRVYDWRYAGEYVSQAKCQEAAAQLALRGSMFRCVDTGRAAK